MSIFGFLVAVYTFLLRHLFNKCQFKDVCEATHEGLKETLDAKFEGMQELMELRFDTLETLVKNNGHE